MKELELHLHPKYVVNRTDGDPTGKHKRCVYFVLDLDHDEHAIAAIRTYARSCKAEKPELAAEMLMIANNPPKYCGCRESFCAHSLGRAFGPDGHGEMASKVVMDNIADATPQEIEDLHRRCAHPEWEYQSTALVRSATQRDHVAPQETAPPDGNGWEQNRKVWNGAQHVHWERDDVADREHWRRRRPR